MNPDLELLQPYPFEKLRQLLDGVTPAQLSPVSLSVGEPKHPAPQFALDALVEHLRGVEKYPGIRGIDKLRQSIARWLVERYGLNQPEQLAAHHILPVNGTREGLFAIAQCLLDRHSKRRSVLMPNPFYQIYEGAALLAGCEPRFYPIDEDADGNIAAISDTDWQDCQMIYLCTPGNPTGAVMSQSALQGLIERAQQHDFIIVSDECYSEIYREAAGPPTGLLQAAHAMGNDSYARCLVFHSLSKRSNLPGLRSGFVAGDARLIKQFEHYRTYHGSSMSLPVQQASIAAWSDEQHVRDNRVAYDAKYQAVIKVLQDTLPLSTPPGGFYLWPQLSRDDQQLTRALYQDQHVHVVPGSYLARGTGIDGKDNPGKGRIRLALVAPLDDCVTAAERIVYTLST